SLHVENVEIYERVRLEFEVYNARGTAGVCDTNKLQFWRPRSRWRGRHETAGCHCGQQADGRDAHPRERSNREETLAIGNHVPDDTIRVRVPIQDPPGSWFKSREAEARRVPDRSESAGDIDNAIKQHDLLHLLVDIINHSGGQTSRGTHRSECIAILTTYLGEVASEVDGRILDGKAVDEIIGRWIPVCCKTGRTVDGCQVRSGRRANAGEEAARIEDITSRHQVDHEVIGGGIPLRRQAGVQIDLCQGKA